MKALNEIKHTPASPNVLRRAQQLSQYYADQRQAQQQQAQGGGTSGPFSPKYGEVSGIPHPNSRVPPPVEPRKPSGTSQGIYAKPSLQQPPTSSFKQHTSQGNRFILM